MTAARLLLRQLVFRTALALCLLLPHAAAYRFSPSAVNPVPESDRVSASQLYVRDIAILSPAKPLNYILLYVDASSARVFISYAEQKNASANNNATFGNIRVSGSSITAVNNYNGMSSLAPTDVVLIEVELFQKQALSLLHFAGDSEVVVLDNVLRAPRAGEGANGTSIMLHTGGDNSSIFVVDPNITIATGRFDIQAYSRGSASVVQVEVAGFNTSGGMGVMYSYGRHDVSLFADQFANGVDMVVNEALAAGSALCVASKTPVNVTTEAMTGKKNAVSSVRPADSPCVKQPIPERVPVFISPSAAVRTTTPPPASAKSSANRLQSPWILAAIGMLVLAITV